MNTLPDDFRSRLRDSLNHGSAPELSTDLVTGAADRVAPKLANPRGTMQVAGGAAALIAAVAVIAIVAGSGLGHAPLFTVAASGSPAGSASANVPAAGLMRIWADYQYHAGAGLSTSGGNGEVYQLTRSGSGAERAAALASVFGLANEVTTVDSSDPANPSWSVGSTDTTTPSLELTWSGTGDWWFSDPAATPGLACPATGNAGGASSGASVPTPGPVVPPTCTSVVTPSTPDNAPTGADARAKAQKLFAQTGLDVAASDIQLNSDPSQTTATANLEVGGVKTALAWQVTWSSNGDISSAYGSSVSTVDRGSYTTISAADAVERLSDSRWSGTAGPEYGSGIRPFAAISRSTVAGTNTGSVPVPGSVAGAPTANPTAQPNPEPTGTPTPVPTDQPTAAPTPVPVPTGLPTAAPTAAPTDVPTTEPTPAPTGPPIIDVTINRAEPTLLLLWDSKGNAWLVPGYAMRIENGWLSSVVSLVPGIIELPPVPSVLLGRGHSSHIQRSKPQL
jgi:hypothetical protein